MHPMLHEDSHLDHHLTYDHLEFIKQLQVEGGKVVVTETTLIDPRRREGTGLLFAPALPCTLFGPIMGDEPVGDDEAFYSQRGDRKGRSRVVKRAPRYSTTMTVVTGPHEGFDCVLFTAYGGPAAPREPFELAEGSDAWHESNRFWALHALAFDPEKDG